ncbi:MAG: hypothetical protein WD470_04460 [Rhodospirillaceae bacterium]
MIRLCLVMLLLFAAVLPSAASAQEQVAPSIPLLQTPGGEKEEPQAPPEPVVIRGWGHSEFGRLVFDWQEPVSFSAKVVGDQLRIAFDRPLKGDFGAAGQKLKRYVSDLRVQAGGKMVSANLKGFFSIRSFANENAVVVDLIPEDGPVAEPDEDPDAWLKRVAQIAVRTGEHPGFGRLVFDWKGEVGYDIERRGAVVRIRFDRPARIDVSGLDAALPGRVAAASSETRKTDVTIGIVVPEEMEIRHFRDGYRVALDVLAAAPPKLELPADARPAQGAAGTGARESKKALDDGDGAPAGGAAGGGNRPLTLTPKALEAQRETERERRASAAKFKDAPLVTVDAERGGDVLDIRFNWRKPVGAAVYRRDEHVYILFDDRARLSVGGLRVVGEGMIEEVEQTDADRMSLVRVKVPEALTASAALAGTVWTVRLAPARTVAPLEQPVRFQAGRDRGGRPELLLGAKGLARPHVFVDRIVGDVLHVYPVAEAGIGNRVARNLVDMDVLESAAGIAVIARRDDLQLLRTADGLSISAPAGLTLSSPDDFPGTIAPVQDSGHIFGGFAGWSGAADGGFEDARHLRMRRVLVAPDAQRNDARLDLARFNLANGMAADAMGILEVILAEDPTLERNPHVRALRGAAHYLLRHYALAAAEFDHPDFRNDPSIAPWLAGIAAARGDWGKANKLIGDSRGAIAALPQWLRTRFETVGAEAALAVRDGGGAKPWLDVLRNATLQPDDEQYFQFLNAHALRLAGNESAAKNAWRRLEATGNRNVRAKAQFALINADLETKHATLKEAIERLEALSFAWRGDAFEFDLKRRLGELYVEDGDYRTALLRLRQAASHFQEVEGAEAIAEDMRNHFRTLFLDGAADGMDAVPALALYEEFRELTPPGADGDEMIRKLADRLVKVDLLAEAARLLEHQIRFRLTGLERSRVGARLALIDLLDRQPARALEALRLSEGAELPEELEFQRRYLTVRALAELGEAEKALAALSGDVSHEAELLRLEIYWAGERWADVARTVRRIIPQRRVDSLTPIYADLVLRWVVALTMQNDLDGLAAIRERFGSAMANTSYDGAFKAIVGVEIGVVPDFKTLVAKTGDISDFQAFMANYRDTVRSSALSAIN